MKITSDLTVTLDKDEVAAALCQSVVARLGKQGVLIEVAKGHATDLEGGTLAAVVTLTPAKEAVK